MKVIGNHSKGPLGAGFVSGERIAGFGHLTIAGQAGEKDIVETFGVRFEVGKVSIGALVQSDVPVTLRFTLSADPKSTEAIWGNTMNVAPGDITTIPFLFTGMEVAFTGAGGILTFAVL